MRCISLNITFQPYCRVSGEANIHCCVTCEGHFPQQVLDLWRNAQFVKVQAEMKPGFRPQDSHSNILTRACTRTHATKHTEVWNSDFVQPEFMKQTQFWTLLLDARWP